MNVLKISKGNQAKTISQISKEAKLSAKKIFDGAKELPRLWITLFVHDLPEYKGTEVYLNNVKSGKSVPTQGLLNDLKTWIKKNKY